jgi:hypothetical protein
MNSARLWRHGKEQFFAWLPALMMALFALGTAWLVRHTPASPPPAARRARWRTSPTTRCARSRCAASTPPGA